MAAIFELDQFGQLPLWAQVLLVARMVRRAKLSFETLLAAHAVTLVDEACTVLERSAEQGDIARADEEKLEEGKTLRDQAGPVALVGESLWWVIDAAGAAQAAQDFPVDATVTNSALNAIRSIAADDRFNSLQIQVVMAGDFDLLRFACKEAGIGTYNGLTTAVAGNLPPLHALTMVARSPRQDR